MLDGGSRFVLKQQLPSTVRYLKSIKDRYSFFDMLKYHSIDFNSYSHFSYLFYGKKIDITDRFNNRHKLIFEDFNEENYITINSHLICDVKERFYIHNNYSGSDHNMNPPSCDVSYRENAYGRKPRCLGDKQIHQHYFQYLKDALKYYNSKKQPVFSELIMMDSHDKYMQSVPRLDNDLYDYIKYLNDNGIMNNSVIILTADHGLHYGKYYETDV